MTEAQPDDLGDDPETLPEGLLGAPTVAPQTDGEDAGAWAQRVVAELLVLPDLSADGLVGARATTQTEAAMEMPPEVAYILGPDDSGAEDESTVAVPTGPPAPPPPRPVSASADLVSSGHRWWRGARAAIALGIVSGLVAVGGAGISYAAYDYGRDYAGRIMPGTVIAGVDVSGMTRTDALAAVNAAIEPDLTRTITLRFGRRTWKVTPEKLGATNDAADAVDAALDASARTSFLARARMRLTGDGLDFEQPVAIDYPRKGVAGFIEGLAASVDRPAREAELDYSTGWLKFGEERVGLRVKVPRSTRALMDALEGGASNVALAMRVDKPEQTVADFGRVLLLRIGENKLYLYENGKITHEWLVATGQPAYPTPTGVFEVVEKRYMPTWVNPAPTTWGADMPASIPPGYGNPLGLRALNWSAPAIRFHGTTATYSLGYNASHGCVRLSNEAVVVLYDLVDVGTPIVSVDVGAYSPLYAPAPDPTLVEADAGDDAPGTGADDARAERPRGETVRRR